MKQLLTIMLILGLISFAPVALAADGDPLLEPLGPDEIDEVAAGVTGDIATYNSTGPQFEWQTPAELNLLTTSANFEDLNDVTITGAAAGDIVYRNSGNTAWINLAIQGSGYFLEGGTTPSWSQPDLSDIVGGVAGANAFDFGGATSLEIPNDAAPTVDAIGEIALDTTITDHKGLIIYDHTGSEDMAIIAIPVANLDNTDDDILKYDAATDTFIMEPDQGGNPGAFPQGNVTISSGIATIGTDNWIQLTGEGDAADALTEIVANALGDIIVLQLETGKAYTVTVTDNAYMVLQNGKNFLLDDPDDLIIGLITTFGANDVFTELSRASNS